MTGLTNYSANNTLNQLAGLVAQPALSAVWLTLFTAVGTDAGTGFTEVTGGSFARVQVAGSQATSASTTAGSAVLTFTSVPAWVTAGMTAYNASAPSVIPSGTTVLSKTGTTVTLSANTTGAGVANGANINFSAFGASSGTAPSSVTNSGVITFPTATADWGTSIAFGLYDASTSGNLTLWDFLGDFQWLPFESTSVNTGNGPVFTVKANGFTNADPVVFSQEYGGTLPTLSAGTITGYNPVFVANAATDSFTAQQTAGGTALGATSTGSGSVRKITRQAIPNGITASFAAGTLTAIAA